MGRSTITSPTIAHTHQKMSGKDEVKGTAEEDKTEQDQNKNGTDQEGSQGENPPQTEPQEEIKEEEEETVPEPDKKALKEQFQLFAKFGDKSADGKSIKLSQSDKWFKQAKVIESGKISTTDTGIAFRKVAKNTPKLS